MTLATTTFPETHAVCLSINNLIADLQAKKIKPFPASLKRRDLVLKGLLTIGKENNKVVTATPVGSAAGNPILFKADEGGYGEALAGLMNTIPVRHGEKPTKGYVAKYNTWSYIEQHHAEQMLFRAAGLC